MAEMSLETLQAFQENVFSFQYSSLVTPTKKEIFELLGKSKRGAVNILDMYADGYTDAFSLYQIVDENIPINYTDHANCVGFRYGKKYNNPTGKGPTSPKTFFLQQDEITRECRFYGGNIIIKPVTNKDQGRDSYYPNQYQYITEVSSGEILEHAVNKSKKELYAGSSIQWDMKDFDMQSASNVLQDFEQSTGILQSYLYYPLIPIVLSDLLTSPKRLKDSISELLASGEHILTQSKLAKVKKVRANK